LLLVFVIIKIELITCLFDFVKTYYAVALAKIHIYQPAAIAALLIGGYGNGAALRCAKHGCQQENGGEEWVFHRIGVF
jgi:hypothetical protein